MILVASDVSTRHLSTCMCQVETPDTTKKQWIRFTLTKFPTFMNIAKLNRIFEEIIEFKNE
jgi:hypothetical protein